MLDSFFGWLNDPFNALGFFSGAMAVCWWGTVLFRARRARLLRASVADRRRHRYRHAVRQRDGRSSAPQAVLTRSPGGGASRGARSRAPSAGFASLPDVAVPLDLWWPHIVGSPITVMIVGESQSGKSTTARALLAERAQTDRIMILDPHEKFNDWGALQETVIGRGRDLDAIVAAVADLHIEFERRFKRDEQIADGLTIFIDEVPAIIAAAPEVSDYLAAWLLEGAKARFRVVFLTQEPGVEALGLKGKGRVRLSTRKVLLGAYAAGVPGALAWPAAIEVRGATVSIDGSALLAMAARATTINPLVAWRPLAELVRDDDDLALLRTSSRTSTSHRGVVLPDTDALSPGSERLSDDDLIAELVRRGVSANKIRDLLGGTKAVVLDKVRALQR